MKIKLLLIIFTIAFVLLVTGCRNNNVEDEQIMGNMISVEKFLFAYSLRFEISIVIEGERVVSSWRAYEHILPRDPVNYFHTDLIFIHSEADAVDFPDNIVLAWPRMGDNNFSQGVINGIHWALERDESDLAQARASDERREIISLEDFGLSYPLSISDFVDNWEKMMELWYRLGPSERAFIIRAAPVGGPREETNDADA